MPTTHGPSRTITRPGGDSDITVSAARIATCRGGSLPLVYVRGFEPDFDVLSAGEARQMARALVAAADEVEGLAR